MSEFPITPDSGDPAAPPPARIAVVDDSDVVRRLVTGHLSASGYEVIAFAGGEAFAEWLSPGRCDAILLDSEMPGWSGLQVLEYVRARFNRDELPILFVTANSKSQHVVEALTRGANDFIVKPFDFAVLSARLALQVALRRSQEELRRSLAVQAQIRAELEHRAEVALTDLQLAAHLQTSIYQFTAPPSHLAASCHVRPSGHVSGDLLFSRTLADGGYLLFLGDATGHGVTAALITMLVVALLRDTAEADLAPRKILNHLNRQLVAYPMEGKFVSGIAMVISPDGKLVAANAGHPPGVVVGSTRPAPLLLASGGPPLGWFEAQDYEQTETQLAAGDVVLAYTDGLTECMNAEGQEFGTESVIRIARESQGQPPETIFADLIEAASRHARENLNGDDVAVAVLRFQPEGMSLPLEHPRPVQGTGAD
jgi:sigma-B regulation protein RsbU (phosphoserine phosphatase)